MYVALTQDRRTLSTELAPNLSHCFGERWVGAELFFDARKGVHCGSMFSISECLPYSGKTHLHLFVRKIHGYMSRQSKILRSFG